VFLDKAFELVFAFGEEKPDLDPGNPLALLPFFFLLLLLRSDIQMFLSMAKVNKGPINGKMPPVSLESRCIFAEDL
jgi:hypothetical protein